LPAACIVRRAHFPAKFGFRGLCLGHQIFHSCLQPAIGGTCEDSACPFACCDYIRDYTRDNTRMFYLGDQGIPRQRPLSTD
jgi:hypothetical protein